MWGAQRIRLFAHDNADRPLGELKELVVQEALNMQAEDEERNRKIGRFGADLLPETAKVLTHCNAGSLATVYFGTALGVIFTAHEDGKIEHVWVDETRPVNQGGRLTAWELTPRRRSLGAHRRQHGRERHEERLGRRGHRRRGPHLRQRRHRQQDRHLRARDPRRRARHPVLRRRADLDDRPDAVERRRRSPIEERDPRELTGFTVAGTFEPDSPEASRAFDLLTENGQLRRCRMARGHQMTIHRKGGGYSFDAWFKITPPGIEVYNPAFDVTPAHYITAFITENGVIYPEPDFETAIALSTHRRQLDPRARHAPRGRRAEGRGAGGRASRTSPSSLSR